MRGLTVLGVVSVGVLFPVKEWRKELNRWIFGESEQQEDGCAMPNGVVEERQVDSLESLLAEERCPFVAAFFSSSSPLSKTQELATMEQSVAASFPSLRYVRVETEYMTIKNFLQWDITFLPTYVLLWPGSVNPSNPASRGWHRWPGKGANPYDYGEVSAWISKVTGLTVHRSEIEEGATGTLVPRGSQNGFGSLLVAWTLVALAVLHRFLNWQPIFA